MNADDFATLRAGLAAILLAGFNSRNVDTLLSPDGKPCNFYIRAGLAQATAILQECGITDPGLTVPK